jgi:hypothetical protein
MSKRTIYVTLGLVYKHGSISGYMKIMFTFIQIQIWKLISLSQRIGYAQGAKQKYNLNFYLQKTRSIT